MSSLREKVLEQPGFILHDYAYRETSLIIEIFTKKYGRLSLIAKGAKRPYSHLRGILHHFQPLALSWSGLPQLRTLTRAEWVGGLPPLAGKCLLYGFYLNELLLKFCAREDPYETLFQNYVIALTQLSSAGTTHASPEPILRHFEHQLLIATGQTAALDWCTDQADTVIPGKIYIYHPERGICLSQGYYPDYWPRIIGQTLIDIMHNNYTSTVTLSQSKQLMRFILQHHLQGKTLNTRKVLIALQQQ